MLTLSHYPTLEHHDLGFTYTIESMAARNVLVDRFIAQAKESDPSVTLDRNTARLLADDVVYLVGSSAEAAAESMRLEIEEESSRIGKAVVAPLVIATLALGISLIVGGVGLRRR